MHHRGEHIGNFFLSDKGDGGEFSSEAEDVLVLFAAQAATAIANARTTPRSAGWRSGAPCACGCY